MKQYIAFLDILGFKDLIKNNTTEEVFALFSQFPLYLQLNLANHETTIDGNQRLVPDVSKTRINSNIISDSIVLWTNDDDQNSFFELVECLQSFLTFCHTRPHIFLRGAITYGDFIYKDNRFTNEKGIQIIHPIMFG